MKKLSMAVVLSATLLAAAVYGQTINSDPEFKKEGQKPYNCYTPDGKRTKCNKWDYKVGKGWKKKCIKGKKAKQDKLFSTLKDKDGKKVYIRTPDNGCASVYDSSWADNRFSRRIKDTDDWYYELLRPLNPSQFRQLVEIRIPAAYELRACMAAHQYVDINSAYYHAGGISVALEEWHRDGERSLMLEIPNKLSRYDTPIMHNGYLEQPWHNQRGDVAVVNERGGQGYVHDGNDWKLMPYTHIGEESPYMPDPANQPVDAHNGHAGLRTAYGESRGSSGDNGVPSEPMATEAIWTCHSDWIWLDPGMFSITVKMNPFVDEAEAAYEDVDGFGAVRAVWLRFMN